MVQEGDEGFWFEVRETSRAAAGLVVLESWPMERVPLEGFLWIKRTNFWHQGCQLPSMPQPRAVEGSSSPH